MSIGARVYEHIKANGPQTMGDLIGAIYGDNEPDSAAPSLRKRISDRNRIIAATGEKIAAVGWGRSFTWRIVKLDQPVRIKPPEPRIFVKGDITSIKNLVGPPAHFPVRTDRFYGNAQPRYGR